jgi:hypothetical protein
MDRVLSMCDRSMDATSAERIALEISAGELEEDFRKCAEVMKRSIDAYHPLIADAIRRATLRTRDTVRS